jgi:hypothetical protein
MVETISQDDLDALWSQVQESEPAKPVTQIKEEAVSEGTITQADLDALWGALGGDQQEKAAPPDEPEQVNGISQADLDALWGALNGTGDEQKNEKPAATGISQDDLNALWGGFASDTGISAVPNEPAAEESVNEHLSQDDIDRLIAEMGK